MSLHTLLNAWRADRGVAPNIVAWRRLPAAPADLVPLPENVHPALAAALRARGILALYSHQAKAWEQIRAGHHTVVVTGTASGKTLCYNLPVLDAVLREPRSRALYLFPTKALAQDQRHELASFFGPGGRELAVATYDGDTPTAARSVIRGQASIVVSNPDMLHAGILPHHTLWADFLRHLRYVVIDEMHAYRGVFGSHVANVLRRLKRVCRFYGSSPLFILTSATIANPDELAGRLIEEDVAVVDRDGSARGVRHFLVYNPPLVNQALGVRRGALEEAVRLAGDLRDHGVQTIVFARARRSAELMLRYLQHGKGMDGSASTRGYRGGYLPGQRREIERGLRDGSVRTVVATNALELGIDIGGMGAAVLAGYPGSIAATRQQAGRAGRGRDESLAVLVASADPLDQYLAQHPDFLLGSSPEQGLVNPDNLLILLAHIRCAAFELPFSVGEPFGSVSGDRVGEFLELLTQSGSLHRSDHRYFWMADAYPASDISLRSVTGETVLLQANGVTIGQVDQASAAWMVHPQAVYLHEGRSYLVEDLDLAQRVARLRPADVDYYTEPRRETAVQLLDVLAQATVAGGTKAHGEIAVSTRVTGYRKVRWFTNEQLGEGQVLLPPNELHTTGYWLSLDDAAVDRLRAEGLWRSDPNRYGPNWEAQRDAARQRDGHRCVLCGAAETGGRHHVHHRRPFRTFPSYREANDLANLVTLCPACHRRVETVVRIRSGLSGLAHVLGHLAPLFLMCDTRDLGVHSDPQLSLAQGRPGVVVYEQVPAGIGFAERLYEIHDEVAARAVELVESCPCEDGCPACVGPAGENGVGGKAEARAILEVLGAHVRGQ